LTSRTQHHQRAASAGASSRPTSTTQRRCANWNIPAPAASHPLLSILRARACTLYPLTASYFHIVGYTTQIYSVAPSLFSVACMYASRVVSQVRKTEDPPPSPHLIVLSLKMQTILNRKSNSNEIVVMSGLVHSQVHCFSPLPQTLAFPSIYMACRACILSVDPARDRYICRRKHLRTTCFVAQLSATLPIAHLLILVRRACSRTRCPHAGQLRWPNRRRRQGLLSLLSDPKTRRQPVPV
jgi:hypothetical protein